MKNKKLLYFGSTIIFCLLVFFFGIDNYQIAKAESNLDSTIGTTGGCGKNGHDSCWVWGARNEVDEHVINGIRISVYDEDGNNVVRAHDFVNKKSHQKTINDATDLYYTNGNSLYGNSKIEYTKGRSGISFTDEGGKSVSFLNYPCWYDSGKCSKGNIKSWIEKEDNMNTIFEQIGYDENLQSSKHFLVVEPVTLIRKYSGGGPYPNGYYWGTAYELSYPFYSSSVPTGNPYAASVWYRHMALAMYVVTDQDIDGTFITNNGTQGVVMAVDPITNAGTFSAPIEKIRSWQGYAIGVFWMKNLKTNYNCDIKNPDHYIEWNPDEKIYEAAGIVDVGGGTWKNCCQELITNRGEEEVAKLYPACLQDSCNKSSYIKVPQCVVGANSATAYTINSKDPSSKKLKVNDYCVTTNTYITKKVNKLCTINCVEEVKISLPGQYQGYVRILTHFVWPTYSSIDKRIGNRYPLTITTNLNCRMVYQKGLAESETLNQSMQSLYENKCLTTHFTVSDLYTSAEKVRLQYKKQDISTLIANVELNKINETSSIENLSLPSSDQISARRFDVTHTAEYKIPDSIHAYVNKITGDVRSNLSGVSNTNPYEKLNYGSLTIPGTVNGVKTKRNDVFNTILIFSKLGNNGLLGSGEYPYQCKVVANDGPIGCECPSGTWHEGKSLETVMARGNLSCSAAQARYCDEVPECPLDTLYAGKSLVDCMEETVGPGSSDEEKTVAFNTCVVRDCGKRYYCPAPLENVEITTCVSGASGLNPTDEDLAISFNACVNTYCDGGLQCPSGTTYAGRDLTALWQTGKVSILLTEAQKNKYCEPVGDPNIIYRSIDLSNPFPGINGTGRKSGSNWGESTKTNVSTLVEKYILNNRGVSSAEVYNKEPMYTVNLTGADILAIRGYNRTTTYDDFNFVCDANGDRCRSEFLSNMGFLVNQIGSSNFTGVCKNKSGLYFDTCRD